MKDFTVSTTGRKAGGKSTTIKFNGCEVKISELTKRDKLKDIDFIVSNMKKAGWDCDVEHDKLICVIKR